MAQTIKLKRSGTQNAVPSTSQLALGEVALNTYDGKMYIKKSVGGTESIVEIGGDATSSSGLDFTGNLNLADDVRIVIGDGNDLQIYHDGSHSYVTDAGTGDLRLSANNLRMQNADNTANYIKANNGSNVELFFNNAAKLTTTSTGVEVTGTLAADQLKVGATERIYLDGGSNTFIVEDAADDLGIYVGGSRRLRVNTARTAITGDLQVAGGDIEFNQSSGQARIRNLLQDTYMRFQVNVGGTQTNAINIRGNNAYVGIGSAEGGSSPVYPLDVYNAGADTVARFTSGDDRARIQISDDDTEVFVIAEGSKMSLGAANSLSSTNLTIDASGSLGIGTTSPAGNLHIKSLNNVGDATLIIEADADNNFENDNPRIELRQDNNLVGGYIYLEGNAATTAVNTIANSLILDAKASSTAGSHSIQFATGGLAPNQSGGPTNSSVRMTITDDGKVGIGTTSPGRKLTIQGGSGDNLPVRIIGGSGTSHGSMEFQDPNTTADYKVTLGSKGDALYFQAGGSEKARITSGGHLLVGKTSQDATNTVGAELKNTGELVVTTDGTAAAYFNRKTSDGTIAEFRKDNSVVGTISAATTNIIYGNDTRGIKIEDALIIPRDVDDTTADGQMDLGSATSRFKNLYLTSQVNAGTISSGAITATTLDTGQGANELYAMNQNVRTTDSPTFGGLTLNGGVDFNGSNINDINQINGSGGSGWLDFNMDTDSVYPQSTADNQTVLGSITHMNFVGDSNGNGTGGIFYWGYGVDSSDSGTFTQTMALDRSGNLTLTGALRGPATFTIDPAAVGDNTGTVVIAGNLQVDGTTTTINSTTLTVDDKNITLASGSTNKAAANGAGITVDCGSDTDATFTYNGTSDQWELNKILKWDYALATTALHLNNNNIVGVNNISFADPGANEGLSWSGGNMALFESPNDLSNASGNLQVTYGGTRRFTVDNTGIDVNGNITLSGNIVDSDQNEIIDIDINDIRFNGKHVQSAYGVWIRGENSSSNNRKVGIDGNSSGTTLQFYVENAERARLNNSGNLGIGTQSPLSKLDVAGDGKFRGTADGAPVLKLGQLDNDANTPLFTVYPDDGGSTRPLGGDALDFNTPRYGQVIGATRGSAAGGNVRSWRFTTSINSNERGVDLILYSQADSSATGSTTTAGNVQLSATSNKPSYINTSGNFGLGTSNPTSKLHLSGDDVNLTLDGTGASGTPITSISLSRGSVNWGIHSGIGGANLFGIKDNQNSAYRLTIDSSGRVGIGTTSPDSLLEISSASATDFLKLTSTGSSASPIKLMFEKSGSEQGIIEYNRNGNLELYNTDPDGGVLISGSASAGNDFYVNHAGKVGVGTTSPQSNIEVNLHSGATSSLMDANTVNDVQLIRAGYSSSAATTSNAGAKWGLRFVGRNDNTYDNQKSGAIYAVSEDSGAGYNRNVGLAFHTSGFDSNHSERMRITNTGNVGIGTTSPSQKLHVAGNIYAASGFVNASGYQLNGTYVVDSSRNLVNIGTISSGAITASNSAASSTLLTLGSSAQTSFSKVDWRTSAHSGSTAYILAYGASHSTNAGNFAMKNLVANGEIFFELASGVEPLRFASNGAATFNKAFTLPTSDGSGNQVLRTDGSGNVSWATVQGVGAPTYMEDADGDTKIQVEEGTDDDTIRFDTAGTQRMLITSSGNVGINSASPAKTLVVGGTFQSTGEAFFSHFDNITSSSRMRDDLRLNFGTARTFAITGNSTNMHMKNGTTDVMTFDTSNRVGIGTASPSQKLEVAGNAIISGSSNLGSNVALNIGGTGNSAIRTRHIEGKDYQSASAGPLYLNHYHNSNIIMNNGGGKVGIGTSTPAGKLHVSDVSDFYVDVDGTDSAIVFKEGGGNFWRIGNKASGDKFNITQDGTSLGTDIRFTIDNGGNVGIGTDSPAQTLHVSSTGTTSNGIRISNSEGSFETRVDQGEFYLYDVDDNRIPFLIDTTGNVGIGTTSPTKSQHLYYTSTSTSVTAEGLAGGGAGKGLLIQNAGTAANSYANLDFRANNADGRIAYQYKGTTNVGDFHFITDNTNSPQTMLFIKNNGPIGLGTTVPGSRLQVGSATADSSNYITFGKRVSSGESNLPFIGHDSKDGTTSDLGLGARSTSGQINFYTGNNAAFTASRRRMIIDANGRLIIAGSGTFTVGGSARVSISTSVDSVYLTAGSSNSDLIYSRRQGTGHFITQAYNGGNTGTIEHNPYGGKVGIGTGNTVSSTFQVEALGIDTTTTTTSATTQVAIDTMAAATFRSAKYTIQVTNSTDSTYHLTEILLIHDGTTPGITEYGTVFTGSAAEATFDADISSGNVRLLATPASTDSMTFKVVRHCITV